MQTLKEENLSEVTGNQRVITLDSMRTRKKRKKYKLIDKNGKVYESIEKGTLGGHKRLKIYGRLDCSSAARYIAKGQYVDYRVFFKDEETAKAAGYRPCGICMPKEYKIWQENQRGNRKK